MFIINTMVLDINLIRNDKQLVINNQKKRFKNSDEVEKVYELDQQWKQIRYTLDKLNGLLKSIKKIMGKKFVQIKKNQNPDYAEKKVIELDDYDFINISYEDFNKINFNDMTLDQIKKIRKSIENYIHKYKITCYNLETQRDKILSTFGNILHESVPIFLDEKNNDIIYHNINNESKNGLNHFQICHKLNGLDKIKEGANIAGHRGYFMMGQLFILREAIMRYATDFLINKGFTGMLPPYFMNKDLMKKVAQLSEFDDQLYKVLDGNNDSTGKYLIATSEQPLTAFNINKVLNQKTFPLKYVGKSPCFRREAGCTGKDTNGIFRVHQFEKVEQFVITCKETSWKIMDEMIENVKEFYDSLGIPYRLVNIVSGDLNNSAAKKIDLEAWFPGSGAFRELVSCSNCTDYQSRNINVKYNDKEKQSYVHMLNCTMCADTRTICAILENNQTNNSIILPKVLKKYMPNGEDFLSYE